MNYGIELYETVTVPEPNNDDIWDHSFIGIVVAIYDDMTRVEDQEGNIFDVEINRLEV